MSEPYRSARCESATPANPALRAALSDEVRREVDESGVNATARKLGVAGSTVSRWGDDLHAWPADALLALAAGSLRLRSAVYRLTHGQRTEEPQPTEAVPGAFDAAQESTRLMNELIGSARDGRFDGDESDRIEAAALRLMELLPAVVRNVRAAAKGRK